MGITSDRRRRLAVPAVLAAMALVAASCGGDDDDEPAAEPAAEEPADEPAAEEPADEPAAEEPAAEEPADEPAAEEPADEPAADGPEGGVSAERLAELEAAVAEAAAMPEFEAQGPAFDVSSLAGKKIFSMPVASSLTGCDNMAKWVVEIAKSVGMTDSFYFQNDGGPAAWQEGMQQALNGEYDGVALVCGIDPNALTPQMEAARDAGIAVVDMHLADVSVPADPLIAGQTNGEFNRSMLMGVYQSLVNSGGEPIDVFVLTSNENPPSVTMEQTIYDAYAELCPACNVSSQNVPIPDWFGGAGQSTIDAALVANPDLDAVFTVYDFMVPVVAGSIQANGSDAKIYAFGGDAPVVATIPDSPLETDMGPGYLWMAYSGADQLFRAMTGTDVIPADQAYAPYRLWVADNAAERATDEGFGRSFIDGYYGLWEGSDGAEPFIPAEF